MGTNASFFSLAAIYLLFDGSNVLVYFLPANIYLLCIVVLKVSFAFLNILLLKFICEQGKTSEFEICARIAERDFY